ncbi:hypothetical protein JDV02_007434 [Purpureocillium takamizusanense]|uniref:Uncharacterized protein n=1 Tax=Purpureocillium takamizusanense TaxID=2060973 RepID=A0A9Q8QKJ1_9HYPO|nr:uncharacterized protein JDV02_007434 [Purpureocillium takamizusanense]UNI21443.1 hypothetical protein JDV02_007434 [Purpureocillium takamizusanense]
MSHTKPNQTKPHRQAILCESDKLRLLRPSASQQHQQQQQQQRMAASIDIRAYTRLPRKLALLLKQLSSRLARPVLLKQGTPDSRFKRVHPPSDATRYQRCQQLTDPRSLSVHVVGHMDKGQNVSSPPPPALTSQAALSCTYGTILHTCVTIRRSRRVGSPPPPPHHRCESRTHGRAYQVQAVCRWVFGSHCCWLGMYSMFAPLGFERNPQPTAHRRVDEPRERGPPFPLSLPPSPSAFRLDGYSREGCCVQMRPTAHACIPIVGIRCVRMPVKKTMATALLPLQNSRSRHGPR